VPEVAGKGNEKGGAGSGGIGREELRFLILENENRYSPGGGAGAGFSTPRERNICRMTSSIGVSVTLMSATEC